MAADKKTLLRDALKQVQAGKIDKAVDTYRAIVRLDLRDAAVRNSLADLLGRQGKKKEAIAEYLEAAALYEKDGFGPRAIAICQKIVKLDPEQWGVRLKLGDLYAAQKLPAEARAIYLQLAERHDKRGEVAAALDIFRRIADLDPGNLPVRVKLAGMFEKQKQPEQAAVEYVRASKGYAEREERDAAVQLLVRAFKLAPANLEARRLLAEFYVQRQEWQVVVGLLETPVARGIQDTALIVLYAEALTKVNHEREAAALLEKLQEGDPNAVPVNLALGRAWLKAGDVEKGAMALNRCVGAHLAENRLDLAASLLQELAAAVPDEDRVLQRIVEVAQKRGDAATTADAYLKLAALYEKKGMVRTAVGALERYLEGRPGDAAAAERLERLRAVAPAAPPAAAPASVVEASPETAPAVAAKPAAAPPAPAAPAAAVSGAEEELEIELDEGIDLSQLAVEGEEELEVEVEGEGEIPEPVVEPASVSDARACTARGAPAAAAAYLEEHLGENPDDVEAWEALVAARRALDSPKAARDALLRLADVHRRVRRFEEARAAYKGALDLDHRSAAAARGLAALIIEEEESNAVESPVPAPVAPVVLVAPVAPVAASPAAEAADAEDLIEISIEEAPAPEPLPAPAAPAEVFDEVSLEEAGQPQEQAPPPAGEYGEISLERAAAGGEAAPAAPAQEYGEIPLDEVAAAPVEPPSPAEGEEGFGELSLEEMPAVVESGQPPVGDEAAPAEGEGEPEPAVPPEAIEEISLDELDVEPEPVPAFEAPAASLEEPSEPAPPEGLVFESFEGALADLDAIEAPEAPPAESQAEAPAPAAAAAPEAGDGELEASLAEADFYLQQGLLDEAEALYAKLEQLSPGIPVVAAQLERIREQRAASPPPDEPHPLWDLPGLEETAPPAAPGGAGVDFADFLGDLRQELEGQGDLVPPPPLEEAGLTEIFQEFQRSVKEQLGDEDFETHYNLGIAYKEMGLTEEAIGEFALAEKSPSRSLDALSMIALCLREQGRLDEAVQKLRTGIALAVEGSEQQKGLLYDLAAAHELAGRADLGQEALQRLHAMDPAYRDVGARLGVGKATPGTPRKKSKVSYL